MKLIAKCKLIKEHLKRKYSEKKRLIFYLKHISIWVLPFLFFMIFFTTQILAQIKTTSYYAISEPATPGATRKLFGGTITSLGCGGPSIKVSRFNNQYALMTGGRGACTINNRYTLGGAGYGIANSIQLSDSGTDTARYFKMGYGGLEMGYNFFSEKKVNIGGNLLIAAGAAFSQSKLKSNDEKLSGNDFNIIPVLEPSFYVELQLNQFIRIHTGISYRVVKSSDPYKIYVPNMSGFSCYAALLFGKS